jgi:hypothetical protein
VKLKYKSTSKSHGKLKRYKYSKRMNISGRLFDVSAREVRKGVTILAQDLTAEFQEVLQITIPRETKIRDKQTWKLFVKDVISQLEVHD